MLKETNNCKDFYQHCAFMIQIHISPIILICMYNMYHNIVASTVLNLQSVYFKPRVQALSLAKQKEEDQQGRMSEVEKMRDERKKNEHQKEQERLRGEVMSSFLMLIRQSPSITSTSITVVCQLRPNQNSPIIFFIKLY